MFGVSLNYMLDDPVQLGSGFCCEFNMSAIHTA